MKAQAFERGRGQLVQLSREQRRRLLAILSPTVELDHYLPNYRGWRWALDGGRIGAPDVLLRAAIGVFNAKR